MPTSTIQRSNPFDLLLNPQAVLDAVQSSRSLARLKGHVHHPLDKPAAVHLSALERARYAAEGESVTSIEDEFAQHFASVEQGAAASN